VVTVAGVCAGRRATTRYCRRMRNRRSRYLTRFKIFRRRLLPALFYCQAVAACAPCCHTPTAVCAIVMDPSAEWSLRGGSPGCGVDAVRAREERAGQGGGRRHSQWTDARRATSTSWHTSSTTHSRLYTTGHVTRATGCLMITQGVSSNGANRPTQRPRVGNVWPFYWLSNRQAKLRRFIFQA